MNAFLSPYLYAPAFVLAWLLLLWLVKRVLIRRLRQWAAKTSITWDDILVDAMSFPLDFLILASGLAMLIWILPLPPNADRGMTMALKGSVIFSAVFFADSLIRGTMRHGAAKQVFGNVSQGVLKGLVRGFVIAIGTLIFLDMLGISITPILASLGIGSLAVALALQDTLSNFFAGLYVTIDKPVQIGDFVKLESGQEGYVTDIGWRSTRIRQLSNNTIVMPNAKLMGSMITNYYLPVKQMGMTIELAVAYDSDLAKVERVTVEEMARIMKTVPGGVAEFEPFVRFHTFGDSGICFSAIFQCREFTDNYLIKHEFIKALMERYRKEGIVIPYPTRALTFDQAGAGVLRDALSAKR